MSIHIHLSDLMMVGFVCLLVVICAGGVLSDHAVYRKPGKSIQRVPFNVAVQMPSVPRSPAVTMHPDLKNKQVNPPFETLLKLIYLMGHSEEAD